MPSVSLAPLLIPRSPLLNRALTITVDDAVFVGFPVEVPNGGDVLSINVVFVLSRGREMHETVKPLTTISHCLASALCHEQRRCKWLSDEVLKLIGARELWLRAQQQAESTPGLYRPDMFDLTEYLLQVSPLCAQLMGVFRRLRLCGTAQICFNGWTSMSVSIWDPALPQHLPLRPYHTILLTDHELQDLAQGFCSPAMSLFLSKARPSKSFRDLQRETGIPLKHLYQLASHVVHWRGAVIAHTVARDSIYVVSPRPIVPYFTVSGTLASKFSTDCPTCPPLETLLSKFTIARTLGEHIDALAPVGTASSQSEMLARSFIQAVCWMLSHGLLIQLHTHVYLTIPVQKELEYLQTIEDGSSALHSFKRLLPLFRQGCHTDEIKWRANIGTQELDRVLERFPGVLVKVLHEAVPDHLLSSY